MSLCLVVVPSVSCSCSSIDVLHVVDVIRGGSGCNSVHTSTPSVTYTLHPFILTHSHSQTHSPTNTLDQILLDRLEEGGVLRPVINEDGLEDVPLSASEALRAQRSDADGSVKSTTAVPSMQGMVLVMVLVMVLRL